MLRTLVVLGVVEPLKLTQFRYSAVTARNSEISFANEAYMELVFVVSGLGLRIILRFVAGFRLSVMLFRFVLHLVVLPLKLSLNYHNLLL